MQGMFSGVASRRRSTQALAAMVEGTQILIRIARGLLGATLALVGVAFQAHGSEGWASLFYLGGLVIAVQGAAFTLAKLIFVAIYLLMIGTVYWLYVRGVLGVSPRGLFEAHGPDWWSYFWWVPALITLVFVALGVVVYRELSDPSDRDGS